jgi:hypothetical protein
MRKVFVLSVVTLLLAAGSSLAQDCDVPNHAFGLSLAGSPAPSFPTWQ